LTSSGANSIGSSRGFAGTSTTDLPWVVNVLTVASSPGMPATTMSPFSAFACDRHTTKSPSRMPASIMESPRTLSMNRSPSPVKSAGSGNTSSTFSWAKTLVPAATSPTSGTCRTGRRSMAASELGSHRTSIARGFVGSRRR
jgi:hypothetical protein